MTTDVVGKSYEQRIPLPSSGDRGGTISTPKTLSIALAPTPPDFAPFCEHTAILHPFNFLNNESSTVFVNACESQNFHHLTWQL